MDRVIVNADLGKKTISRYIYGHFAEHLGRCIYEGIWVGEDSPIPNIRGIRTDVIEALRKIKPAVLRWPGGCFADEYHWMDGIGPRGKRPRRINTHWGGVIESNDFGTHEFLDFCELIGAEPYICGNVGSGTVEEMARWVEYITFDGESTMAELRRQNGREKPWRLPFFGVGNENWGCGGHMRAEFYADMYRRYQTYVRNYSGNRVYKIACGPNSGDYHWTEVLMREAGRFMNGLSLHYYTVPGTWAKKGSATQFGEDEWFVTLKKAYFMEELIIRHSAIMDRYDPERRVGLIVDEWGTWYDVEPGSNPGFLYQQNTLRDALVAGLHLNLFNNHCHRVRMANIAQTINVLQAMILTEGDKMVVTPTYHVFEMYKGHQDATLLPVEVEAGSYSFNSEQIPALSASASRHPDGYVTLSLCHFDPHQERELSCELRGMRASEVRGRVLTAAAMNAHNTFSEPDQVRPAPFDAVRLDDKGVVAVLPPKSVVVLEIR